MKVCGVDSLEESGLVEIIISWIIAASSCHGRLIRHTCTLAGMGLGSGLVTFAQVYPSASLSVLQCYHRTALF